MFNRIVVIGGGNMGMALSVELVKNTNAEIILLTSKYNIFDKMITGIDIDNNLTTESELYLVTDNYERALENADIVFITNPAFIIPNVVKKLTLTKKTTIFFIPGTGGREFLFKDLLQQGHLIAGLDRVPYVARINEPGKSVSFSKKKKIRFASFNNTENSYLEEILSSCLNITSEPISNYLNVTFTPSNQILHTSRLYALFSKNSINDSFERQIKFYAEWDNISSDYLLSVDDELQKIYKEFNLSEVISLKAHYESENSQKLTEKIRSIKSLSNIDSPLIEKDNMYFIDTNSRYFQEDFPFGLCIIKDFSVIANIDTPFIDKILNWYSSFFNLEYFVNGVFNGKDIHNLPLPRNFGINTKENVYNYYKGIAK
jgi:hypothetical protein